MRVSTVFSSSILTAALLGSCLTPATAQEQVLNLYSARHYQTDEALYANFTKNTGIRINRVDTDDAGLLARLKSEGAASPADVILLVDAARLWQAEEEGLFQAVKSARLEERIPAQLRAKPSDKGSAWFGLSTRARVIVYNKQTVKKDDVLNYQDLGNPKNKGRLCTRSGSHPYNLSLFGSVYEHMGAEATEAWLKGMVANMARAPKGGDTDQIKAVASGECGVAISNTYYLARMMRSEKPEDRDAMEKIAVVFPNQQSWGTHINIAGGAVARHAKNRDNAIKFLEYLSSNEAQAYFANGNNEWPAVTGVRLSNAALESFGNFKSETIPIATVGANQPLVQKMLDRVGYK
ncbi:Fe(3+) ABC transporter substrate-binding protein [Paucibacter sp. Y2R2-4]|uniref:Fe(3+) ABC transporter substrate-binding protein n=1 Tax=Paucibacter sp. Y2R2-4 TaxID=2893553 RepID=UPI0021E424AD|nr:Fe(3+) ABC transporter substrate-binding protein [Paucibacter sp. Y2R2-4]MCV2349017.1 Fe(3+) ABC transporter substrate-binding protein [Paucibacter sp. Y2R2-4]